MGTWGNHLPIMRDSGVEPVFYEYYDPATYGLNWEGMKADLEAMDEGDIVMFHACAHNPTGVDPKPEHWTALSKICKEKGLFPVFDMAYQGFASGDCDFDATALRAFVADGHNPPINGARIAATVMSDIDLRAEWMGEVKGMADRIITMRTQLKGYLAEHGSTLNWDHVVDQIGMFCFTGLTQEQVAKMASDHSIYLTKDGRISIAGVSSANVECLAKAMHDVTK